MRPDDYIIRLEFYSESGISASTLFLRSHNFVMLLIVVNSVVFDQSHAWIEF